VTILLDTATFLWFAVGAPQLSTRAGQLLADPAHDLVLSAVSAWEIAVKSALGKLSLPAPPDRYIPALRGRLGVASLDFDEDDALTVARLPLLHRDPFDRMLLCQASRRNWMLLTPDPLIRQYPGVATDW
jgi:PIN domain nuclease of toxin-antitoxin system